MNERKRTILYVFLLFLEPVGGLEPPTFCSPKKSFDFSGTPYQSHAVRLREISSPSVLNLFYTKKRTKRFITFRPSGAGGRTRTADLLITNQLLYRLSHTSILL